MVKNFYKNKRVLITGATGFKGAWLSYWLHLLEAKVYGLGYNPNKNKNLFYNLKLDKKIKLKLFDIRDKKKLKKFISLSKPQIIFHLAAQPLILDSYNKPYLTYTVNSIGTLNVLETVRETDSVKSLICITSDKCYESNYSTKGFKEDDKLGGKDPYSGSKASAEIMIKSYQESFFKYKKCGLASGRAGNVIGGGDWSENRLIPDAVNSIIKGKTINIRNPKFNRPWQHVLEPLYGYLLLGEKLFKKPKIYSSAWNFGTKKNTVTNVLEIVSEIVKFWGKGKISFKKNQKYYEQTNLQLNIEKSIKILKWKPKYTITKSVQLTAEWYKKVLIEKFSVEKITKKQIKDYMNERQ
jgi:CDP-glucose 4,6-dehydratase